MKNLKYNVAFSTVDRYNYVVYSCDMITIKSQLSKPCLLSVTNYLENIACNYYQSFKKGTYMHLFTLGCEFTSICVKIGFNHPTDLSMDNCIVIQFNPNKMSLDEFKPIFYLLGFCKKNFTRIASIDLAIDFPFPRDYVFLRYDRENYSLFKNRTGVTEYTGKRMQHNSVKLYDKSGESSLDTPLTRLEITWDISKELHLPYVYFNCYDDLPTDLSNSDIIIIRALNSMIPSERRELFKNIERKKRLLLSKYIYSADNLIYLDKYCIEMVKHLVYDTFILDVWENIKMR